MLRYYLVVKVFFDFHRTSYEYGVLFLKLQAITQILLTGPVPVQDEAPPAWYRITSSDVFNPKYNQEEKR